MGKKDVYIMISIHAPSRERLFCALVGFLMMSDFNPRSLTGATTNGAAMVVMAPFQSTLPHGSDYISLFLTESVRDFNPRSLTGATSYWDNRLVSDFISIHAPSRERQKFSPLLRRLTLFQSTLPHGSDHSLLLQGLQYLYFNPRSLTGATNYLHCVLCNDTCISIHAPSRERPQANIRRSVFDNFNPRSLTGATLSTHIA